MSFATLIPTTFAALGSICLALALVLILVEPPGSAPWQRIAGICAFIGGGGVVGGAGGWIGTHITSWSSSTASWLQDWGSTAIGSGALIAVLLLGGLWAYSHIGKGGKGTEAGGKGRISKRLRAGIKAGVIAMVGAFVFSAIPQLYSGADWLTAQVGGSVQSLIA